MRATPIDSPRPLLLSRIDRLFRRERWMCSSGSTVSLSKTSVCVVDRDGAMLWQSKAASEPGPLIARLAEWSGTIALAGIEACPLSEWLHRGLREAGIPVVCIEV